MPLCFEPSQNIWETWRYHWGHKKDDLIHAGNEQYEIWKYAVLEFFECIRLLINETE